MLNDKIYFYMPNFNPGGAEHVIVELANYLNARGHKVGILVAQDKGPLAERVNRGISIIDFNCSIISSIFPLIKFYYKQKPNLVISTLRECNIYSVVANIITGGSVNTVLREANTLSSQSYYEKKIRDVLKSFLVKKLYKYSRLIICLSQEMKKDLLEVATVDESQIRIIGNPVDQSAIGRLSCEEIEDEVKKFIAKWNNKLMLSVGRLNKQKNISFGVRIVKELKDRGFDFAYLIVGDGIEKDNLKRLVDDYDLSDRVLFLGYQKNPFKYMRICNILFMPSIYEGLPNVLLQASCLGMKALVSDSPGAGKGIVEKSGGGLVYKENCIEDATVKLIKLSGVNHDSDFQKKYIDMNYSHAKIFSEYETLFKQFGI
jgi:glycosyltransferase involved in cell wall biosynthesis